MPEWIRRWAYRGAARVLGVYRYVFRPTVRGVRCALTRGDEVLLVRHTYGDRRWGLPGGLVKRGEEGEATARRELREELGLDVPDLRSLGSLDFRGGDRARHVVESFAAPAPDAELTANSAEIAELGWFSMTGLPADLLEGTDDIVARAAS